MLTKDNYEAMLLQYHEGLLDDRRREEVEAFLSQHPDIEQEYRQFYSSEPIVTPPSAHYLYKGFMKRQPTLGGTRRYWAAAACIAVLFATAVWLWVTSQPGSDTASAPTVLIASTEPATAVVPADSCAPAIQTCTTEQVQVVKERCTAVASVIIEPESKLSEEMPFEQTEAVESGQPPVCESDRLVVYGCRIENRQDLVACPDEEEPCHNLVCRLILTGQRIGMLSRLQD